MNQYRSLRDMPGAKTGTLWKYKEVDNVYQPTNMVWGYDLRFTENFIKAHPDWFELIKPETLEEAVGKFLETTKHMGIGVKTTDDGERLCKAFNDLSVVYNRIKGEKP